MITNGNGLDHRRAEVQQAVKSACDMLNADGVAPRDYVEQLAWLFFLKAFDETEARLEEEARFEGTLQDPVWGLAALPDEVHDIFRR